MSDQSFLSPSLLFYYSTIRPYYSLLFYNWYEGEVFGVEIQNEKIAAFQKQLFNIVWQMAEK